MISVQYQVKPFNIKEAEVEQLYEALLVSDDTIMVIWVIKTIF